MNTTKTEMTTVNTVLENLRHKKQDTEFFYDEKGFTAGKGKYYTPEELTIIKTYRFEGDSNPSDMSVIYLIKAADGLIGYIMDAYGSATNHGSDFNEFIQKIEIVRTETEG